MVLESLLKIMVAVTLFYVGLQVVAGLDVTSIIIILLIIDFAVYQLDKAVKKHEIFSEAKIDSLKRDFDSFNEKVSSKMENSNPENIGEKFETHKNEVSELIDRIARKGLDLENAIGDVKKTLGAVYGAVDDRLKLVENHLGIRKEEEKELEEPVDEEQMTEQPITVAEQAVEYVEES
jgi:exonuclease VII small subunit